MSDREPISRAGTSRAIDARAAADELFGSTGLVDVLILLCKEPDRRYYVNELIKITGRFPRSIQLALARLEAAGLVESERQANARFYHVVTDHPFVPELRALFAKIPNVVDALRAGLKDLPGIRVAFLRPESSDSVESELVVVGEAERGRIEEAVARVGERLGRAIRVECFVEEEWARQARRERSFVRWLLEEERSYVLGSDAELPG